MSREITRPYEIHERQADGSWEVISTWETEKQAEADRDLLKRLHPLRSYMIVYNDIERVEEYTDFYGCKAVIVISIDGKANLLIRTSKGAMVHAKTYSSYRGAKIAMGMAGDCWRRAVK